MREIKKRIFNMIDWIYKYEPITWRTG